MPDINSQSASLEFDKDTRASFTFLDLANKEYAVNDEVLIDKNTGEIYYKKKDGKIVPSNKSVPNTTLNVLDLSGAISKSDVTVLYPTSKSVVMVMMEHRLVNEKSLIDKTPSLEDFTFRVSKETNGFFFNPKSRISDKNVIEILTALYNYKHSSSELKNASINYTINYYYKDGTKKTVTESANVRMNVTTFIHIGIEDINDKDELDYIEVILNSIHSKIITDMVKDDVFTTSSSVKYLADDKDICIESFDVNSFMDDTNTLPDDKNTTINNIYNLSDLLQDIYNIGGSSKKLEELEALIKAIPRFIVSETIPENFKVGDTWCQITGYANSEEGNYTNNVNVYQNNLTFSKDELEKYLVSEGEIVDIYADGSDNINNSDEFYIQTKE